MKEEKDISIPRYRALTVKALKSILDKYPGDAKIYCPALQNTSVVVIWKDGKDLAKIEFVGY